MKHGELEIVKSFTKMQIDTYSDGVIFAITEKDTITWQISSDNFKHESYLIGQKVDINIIERALKQNQKEISVIYDETIRKTLKLTAIPIMDDTTEESIGVFLTIIPQVNSLQKAFHNIAPIITELFPEGAFISLTDTKEIIQVQRSEKYDIPVVEPGFDITHEEGIMNAINTSKWVRSDDDTLKYGPPVRVLTAPYFEDETSKVAGVVNIIRPKEAELSLRNMSVNLERQLSEVALTIQDLAEASGTIHSNEQEVNKEIEEITVMANEIVEVSNMIKSIADATKMLGLNASIEAARAGTAGRGFSVVANEINKLSEQSKNTVPKIKKFTDDIKTKVEETKQKSHVSLSSSQEQVAATEEITATIEEIQSLSIELANIANTI